MSSVSRSSAIHITTVQHCTPLSSDYSTTERSPPVHCCNSAVTVLSQCHTAPQCCNHCLRCDSAVPAVPAVTALSHNIRNFTTFHCHSESRKKRIIYELAYTRVFEYMVLSKISPRPMDSTPPCHDRKHGVCDRDAGRVHGMVEMMTTGSSHCLNALGHLCSATPCDSACHGRHD